MSTHIVVQPSRYGEGNSTDSNNRDTFDRYKLANLINQLGGSVAAARLRDCGEGGRGWVGVCPLGHSVYHPFGCMLRVCPRCSAMASRKLSDRLTPAVIRLVELSPATLGLKHITLTTCISLLDYVKVGAYGIQKKMLDSLRELIKLLRLQIADMFRDKFKGVDGCGWAIGVEFGANMMLHFHVLALIPFWDNKDLSKQWAKYSVNAGRIVYIQAAARDHKDVSKAVGYVTKYVTKPLGKKDSEAAPVGQALRVNRFVAAHGQETLLASIWYLFKSMRRFQTYASFYSMDFDIEEPENCPECGAALRWISELESLTTDVSVFLNSLKTIKSDDGVPKVVNISLWDRLNDDTDIDFFA